ncbi:MAG: DUF1329 domain-containing protein [Porticoccaceae bacterium]
MSIYKQVVSLTGATLFSLAIVPVAWAQDYNEKPTAAEIAKLGLEGTELTPAGAIRAGNAEGTIPEWKNEPLKPPADFKPGTFHPDPFAADKVLFTITAQNYQQYADKLTPGQQKMFETYPDYFMNIYPTRRSAVFKPYIYQAAIENTSRAEIVMSNERANMIAFKNAVTGWAFPLAKNGPQALMNIMTRPVTPWVNSWDNIAPVTSSGSYEVVKLSVQLHWPYSDEGHTLENFDVNKPGTGFLYYQTATAPAKQAGQVVLAREPMSFFQQFRQAWSYSPGQRRVKRAPQIVYDNPLTSSDGLATTDQKYGWNGPNDRFEWTLEGRHEIYVPYNAYKLHTSALKVSDIITKSGRLNQDLVRYELHRVWKLVSTLRQGTTHDYGKRVFYLDEDSWWVSLVDGYDRRNQLWRYYELHPVNYYDVGFVASTIENQYDMSAGRMVILGLDNEDTAPDFTFRATDDYFTPAEVRRQGVR